MVFCGPKAKKGQELSAPAMLHDIVPTLWAMLGWQPPETAAGKTLEQTIT